MSDTISDDIGDSARTVMMLLDDRRTFSGLDKCQIFTVPDAWTTDQITDALRGDDDLTPHLHVITTFRCRPGE